MKIACVIIIGIKKTSQVKAFSSTDNYYTLGLVFGFGFGGTGGGRREGGELE